MMTVIVAPIPSNISMMAGALALGFWPAMILGVLAVGVGVGDRVSGGAGAGAERRCSGFWTRA